MPTSVQSVTGGAATQSQATTQPSILGKDDFLQLLTMQLRYQDPMDPMKGTEFAAQLAQFSSVEQLSNINSTLTASIDANYVMTQSINNALSATFVGKDVRATGNTFHLDDSGPAKMGYSLPSAASTVSVKIYDDNGTLIRTLPATGTSAGDNAFTWDGSTDAGGQAPEGKYKFVVEAKDASGASLTASSYIVGTVSGVRFKSDGTVFVVDGMEVKLSDIIEIMQG
jgi:flagellar basal-body rod modification protein FlgD